MMVVIGVLNFHFLPICTSNSASRLDYKTFKRITLVGVCHGAMVTYTCMRNCMF